MRVSPKTNKPLGTNPGWFIEQGIVEWVRTSPDSRLSFINKYLMWDRPLVRFADGDDPIFTEFKSIISPGHFTPREALAKVYNKNPENMPAHLSVISWILPIAEKTRTSNRAETRVPSRLWSHTRWLGEKSNEKLREYVVECLTSMGYLAIAPASQPFFLTSANEKGEYSNWSERHVAYAAGHGTFSLSDGLITKRGIAHRCGSVVTSLIIPASPRIAKDPYSNCLFYRGIKCRACIKRCPAGAITEKGHDKVKCREYMKEIGYTSLKDHYDIAKSVAGCGLCQTNVPCEFRNPVSKFKEKTA